MFHLTPWRSLDGDGYPWARLRENVDSLMAGFLENRQLENRQLENRILGYRPAQSDNARFDWIWELGWEDQEKEHVFRVDLPGFDAEDFNVQLDGDVLTISAGHNQTRTTVESGSKCHCRSFVRTITLPDGVNASKIVALYHSGVFEIRVTKTEEVHHRRIDVNGNRRRVIAEQSVPGCGVAIPPCSATRMLDWPANTDRRLISIAGALKP